MQARVGELANELAPHQLSSALWALGKLQAYPGIEVMETLVTRSRLSLPDHAPQVCKKTLLGLVSANAQGHEHSGHPVVT